MVIGEVVPKNVALEKADRLATLVAPVLLIFSRIASPFVWVAENTTTAVSHALGLRGGHAGGGHSLEEIKFIISSSRSEGHLKRFEEDAIQALLDLHEYSVREIMVPRNQIVSIPVDATFDELLRVMRMNTVFAAAGLRGRAGEYHRLHTLQRRDASGRRGRDDTLLRHSAQLRKPLVVPETKALNDLIDEFRTTHVHMAMVVDEFGTIAGLVTLEDVLEQIFGEIGDEHDVKRPEPKTGEPVMEFDGSTTIRDLDNQYELKLPGEAGFETLAGFVLFQLGYIPKVDETLEYGGRRFTVLKMDRNRIARVRIENLPAEPVETPAG